MNWSNVNLNNQEVDSKIVDDYSFSTLLLEVEYNVRKINKKTIEK
jgi:hypothetical protein